MPPSLETRAITYDDLVYNATNTYTINPAYAINAKDLVIEPDYAGRPYDFAYENFITRGEFEALKRTLCEKIYEVISTHTSIDITEEEFMKLLELE